MAAAATQLNIAKAPQHHAKLLEVIQKLDATLNANSNIHFYVTGGAAAAYHLPSKEYPINDIDCICVINPALDDEAFARERNAAIRTTKTIVKSLLESLIPAVSAGILSELPTGTVLTNKGFLISSENTNGYNRPADNVVTIPDKSPFTGIEYYDPALKVRVISIRHRFHPYRTLLDISFPMKNYERIDIKWADRFERIMMNGVSIPVLSKEALAADQKYAAEYATATQVAQKPVREKRANNLRKAINIEKVMKALPRVTATIARIGPPTGGAGTVVSPPPIPPPRLSIYMNDGRVFLSDHSVRRSWPAREPFDPYTPEKVYSFETGFRGPIGDYWQYSDGYYRLSPPSSR
jgi:hypothetical protein